MNIITFQLQPLAHLLSGVPIPKEDFIRKAKEHDPKENLIPFLEMIEFEEVYRKGNEIVLK